MDHLPTNTICSYLADLDDPRVERTKAHQFLYQDRPAAYAVITGEAGTIAAVQSRRWYFLPGGGALSRETPEATLEREVREELARSIRIIRRIGEAVQYFAADGQHYRMQAVFFAAEFTGELPRAASIISTGLPHIHSKQPASIPAMRGQCAKCAASRSKGLPNKPVESTACSASALWVNVGMLRVMCYLLAVLVVIDGGSLPPLVSRCHAPG
jgi:8-oxo-dGTP pyrophosphatase MutT (NUDIX family)